MTEQKIALFYQSQPPPIIHGVKKAMKPTGYRDGSADIAYSLCRKNLHNWLAQKQNPESKLKIPTWSVIIPHREEIQQFYPEISLDFLSERHTKSHQMDHLENYLSSVLKTISTLPDFCFSFPDTPEGIREAIASGAKILWFNTVLFEGHPMQDKQLFPESNCDDFWFVCQHPAQVQKFDDKYLTNQYLAAHGVPIPKTLLICATKIFASTLQEYEDSYQKLFSDSHKNINHSLPKSIVCHEIQQDTLAKLAGIETFPVIVKPIRGRGSAGVSRVNNFQELKQAIEKMFPNGEPSVEFGDMIMVEEFLSGEEYTVTIFPSGVFENIKHDSHSIKCQKGEEKLNEYTTIHTMSSTWSLPPVYRFDHHAGIMPYNGLVPVTANSRVLTPTECAESVVIQMRSDCEKAAALVNCKAPIRIDCRIRNGSPKVAVLFDLNPKPNLTGPGRVGRDDQESLVGMSAKAIGWSFEDLVHNYVLTRWKQI
jgi:D-alanine-D-alanine ligase